MNRHEQYTIKKVSVVIPAQDEADTVGMVLDDVKAVLGAMPVDSEIIVVNDHSHDRTAEVTLSKKVALVSNPYRSGKGNALRAGFKASSGDVIVMMDADCSHDPKDLPAFLDTIQKGAGMVIGSRIYGGSDEYTRIRALGNIFFTALFGCIFGRYLSDVLNGYKAFRRDVVEKFPCTAPGFEIEIELAANALRCGYAITEIPSHEKKRAGGTVKSNVIVHGCTFLFRMIYEGVKYYNDTKAVKRETMVHP